VYTATAPKQPIFPEAAMSVFSKLAVIVNLAIIAKNDTTIFIKERLCTCLWINDCQTPMRQADIATTINPLTVRTSVFHCLIDRFQISLIYWLPIQIDNSGHAAHYFLIPIFAALQALCPGHQLRKRL
jgi:hypothetical protein